MRLRSISTVLAAGAACLAALGCGSTQATLDPIAQAADTTTHAGGAQIAIAMTVQAPGLGSPMRIKGNGDFNLSHEEGELFMHIDGLPASSGAPAKLDMTDLFKDGVLYITTPLLEGKLPNGAKWMKLDLAAIESKLGIDPQSLSSGESDPTQFLRYLKASGGSVRETGQETIRGTETTRYEGVIDVAKMAEQVASGDRQKTEEAIDQLISETGTRTLPVTVWVDGKHLVRRMSMKIPITSDGQSFDTSLDYEMFGFGATPAVNPPPASETFDASKLSLPGLSSPS